MENQTNVSRSGRLFYASLIILFISIVSIFGLFITNINSGFEGLVILIPVFGLAILALISAVVMVLSHSSTVFLKLIQSVVIVIIDLVSIPFLIEFVNSGQYYDTKATIIDIVVAVVGVLVLYRVWSRK